jgi:hypothetical protein
LGLNAGLIIYGDITVPEIIQQAEQQIPLPWRREFETIGGLIDVDLWRIKLLLYDDVKLVDNLNKGDALKIFKQEGELLTDLSHYYLKSPEVEHMEAAIAADQGLQKLLRQHHIVMAEPRMLSFCRRIPRRISSMNTGYNVLLA